MAFIPLIWSILVQTIFPSKINANPHQNPLILQILSILPILVQTILSIKINANPHQNPLILQILLILPILVQTINRSINNKRKS